MLYFASYLLIGLIFTKIVDSIAKSYLPEEQQFTNWERFSTVLLWPINLVIFVTEFIREYLSQRKNNR